MKSESRISQATPIMKLWRLLRLLLLSVLVPPETCALSTKTATSQQSPSHLPPSPRTAATRVHESECDTGFRIYGRCYVDADAQCRPDIDDTEFVSVSVGERYSGPEVLQRNGDVIFQSNHPLVSATECQSLVEEARHAITERLKTEIHNDDSERPTNAQLGEARVSTLEHAKGWLADTLHSTFFPLLAGRYGVDAAKLTLHDALIIGYGYFGGGSKSQPIHRDSSLLSLNVALSSRSDYVGGGTYFEPIQKVVHQDQGHATCHSGGIMHAGRGISKGERWILVLFVISEDDPQLARRHHGLALDAQKEQRHEEALQHFQAALEVTNKNHLIHKDMGRTLMQLGDIRGARQSLRTASRLYPFDADAAMGLAVMLISNKKYRAALRQLDRLIEDHLPDSELSSSSEVIWKTRQTQGLEARILSARCAIQCAQYPKLFYGSMAAAPAASPLLKKALQRLELCSQYSPDHPDIAQLQSMAEFFYLL